MSESNEVGHTPTPYSVELNPSQDHRTEVHAGGLCIAFCGTGNLALANSRFIVRACNAHDELVGALREALEIVNPDPQDENYTHDYNWQQDAIALIAKLEDK